MWAHIVEGFGGYIVSKFEANWAASFQLTPDPKVPSSTEHLGWAFESRAAAESACRNHWKKHSQ